MSRSLASTAPESRSAVISVLPREKCPTQPAGLPGTSQACRGHTAGSSTVKKAYRPATLGSTALHLGERAFGDEVSAERDERDGGDLLSTLPEPLAYDGTKGQPKLAGDQRLHPDGHDDRHHWQPHQAQAEADGELVHADADPKRDHCQAVRAR